MLSILFLMTVGGFTYDKVALSDRTKPIASAPDSHAAAWRETIQTLVAADPRDAAFSLLMREQAAILAQDYYRGDTGSAEGSFENNDVAGWLEVTEEVVAASPDIVSVHAELGFFEASMAHPENDFDANIVWSRKLQRPLKEKDVFALLPDLALRRLALSLFDNRQAISDPLPDGLPLDWDRATIGPRGITWSFKPYELGGYLSGGTATIGWAALRPYLRRDLPFEISALRAPGPSGS